MNSFSYATATEFDFEAFARRPSGFSAGYNLRPPPMGLGGPTRGDWAAPRPFVVSTDQLWPLDVSGQPLILRRPIEIETSDVDGGVLWKLPEFDLVVEAVDNEHAEAAMSEQLTLLKDAYINEPDESLTPGAIEVKRKLSETFG